MSLNLGDFNPVRILAGKGEIGKTGLGSALATLALDAAFPGLGSLEAAGIVGGGTALASGSLQKGLMAGLSAYGTHELAGAAEKGISDTAARSIDFGDIAGENPVTPLTSGEQFKAGLSALKAMPTKELLQYGAMAAAPVLMGQNSSTGLPTGTGSATGYIRPKAYDPATHRYYDLPAIKAGDFGGQSISDYVSSQVAPAQAARGGLMAAYAGGGMTQDASSGGMFNYAQMQPAVNLNSNSGVTPQNMAKGGRIEDGVRRFDIGGENAAALASAYNSGSDNLQSLINSMGVTQADVNQYFPGFDVNAAGLSLPGQTASATPSISAVPAISNAIANNAAQQAASATPSISAVPAISNAIANNALNPYTSYTNDQYGAFFADPKNAGVLQTLAGLTAAEAQYHADPNEVNKYITGLANNYYDPTDTKKGYGTLGGVYQNLIKENVAPSVFSAAEKAVNPDWGKTGYWNQDTIAKAYQVADKILQFDPLTDKVTPSDKEWVAFMDKNNISTKDISIATGLSQNEVDRRYAAAKTATPTTTPTPTPTTPTSKVTDTGGVVPGGTQLPNATTYNNGAYGNYGSGNKTGIDYLGGTTSIATPGDIITNPDLTRTVVSNTPGRPYGGFTGMDALTRAYTAGGGHLGQTLKPTQTYQNTGGSKAAYDYLSGLGSYAATKTQPDIKPKNTYSNFNAPSADEIKQFSKYAKVFKNGVVVDNPYYNKGNIIDSNAPVANLINQVSNDAGGGLAGGGSANSLRTLLTGDAQNAYDKLDAKGLGNSKQAKQLKQELDYRARMKAYQQTPQVMPTVDQTDDQTSTPFAAGGQAHYNLGGYSDGGRLLRGPGDGVSDSIPATIGNKQPARLADGEFVVPARIVSEIGNGSTEAGARKLYAMMDRVQSARSKTVGKGKVAKNTRADKYLPA
jgi:hypothetical protein